MFQLRQPILSCLVLYVLLAISTAGCFGLIPPSKGAPFQSLAQGMQDPALEAAILGAARKRAEAEHWRENFTKVKISSTDWAPLRNDSEVIVGRFLWAWVYATYPAGYCGYQQLSFEQGYDGHRYLQRVELRSMGDSHSCPCE